MPDAPATPSAKTSAQWWDVVRADPTKLNAWLVKQYFGELDAAKRIEAFRLRFCTPGSFEDRTLRVIVKQEATHAEWVLKLLVDRVPTAEMTRHEARYWAEVKPDQIDTFEQGCAIGAHAEEMRLRRIRVIANDYANGAHEDIRRVFQAILPEEEFHAAAFLRFTTDAAHQAAASAHADGLNALGLTH